MPETTTTTPAIAGAVPVGAAGAIPVISVIDIGSSGVRMLLAELKPDGSVRELEDVQKPLALGRETFRTGTLSAASIQKSVNMLRQYRAIMDGYGVTHTRAVATSVSGSVCSAHATPSSIAFVECGSGNISPKKNCAKSA